MSLTYWYGNERGSIIMLSNKNVHTKKFQQKQLSNRMSASKLMSCLPLASFFFVHMSSNFKLHEVCFLSHDYISD